MRSRRTCSPARATCSAPGWPSCPRHLDTAHGAFAQVSRALDDFAESLASAQPVSAWTGSRSGAGPAGLPELWAAVAARPVHRRPGRPDRLRRHLVRPLPLGRTHRPDRDPRGRRHAAVQRVGRGGQGPNSQLPRDPEPARRRHHRSRLGERGTADGLRCDAGAVTAAQAGVSVELGLLLAVPRGRPPPVAALVASSAVRQAVSGARLVDPPGEPRRNQRHHHRHQVDAALVAHDVDVVALVDEA